MKLVFLMKDRTEEVYFTDEDSNIFVDFVGVTFSVEGSLKTIFAEDYIFLNIIEVK